MLDRIRTILEGPQPPRDKLQAVCRCLRDGVAHYDWVGFYLVSEAGGELVLGPYEGAPTEHVRIPFGRGICGQAAEREETLVVQDVRGEPNYLSCSLKVRSEIVVPIFRDGDLAGEIDVDSHTPAPFNDEDRRLLEEVSRRVGPLL